MLSNTLFVLFEVNPEKYQITQHGVGGANGINFPL